jgi:hypothetical protein
LKVRATGTCSDLPEADLPNFALESAPDALDLGFRAWPDDNRS